MKKFQKIKIGKKEQEMRNQTQTLVFHLQIEILSSVRFSSKKIGQVKRTELFDLTKRLPLQGMIVVQI
jgi:hypothetical protein